MVSERVKIFQIFPLVNKEERRNVMGCALEAGPGTVLGVRRLLRGQHLCFELNCALQKDTLKS